MKIDFKGIFSKSWEIIKNNRFLWLLGFLGPGFGASSVFGNFNFGGNPRDEDFNKSLEEFKAFTNNLPDQIEKFVSDYWGLITLGFAIFIIFALVMIWVRARFLSAGITAINNLYSNKKTNLKDSLKSSKHGTKEIIYLILLLFVLSLFVTVPAIYIFWQFIKNPDPETLIGFVYLIPYFLAAFVLSLPIRIIAQFTTTKIALENKKTFESIKESFGLFRNNLKNTFLMWFWSLVAGIVGGILLGLLIFLAILVLAIPTVIFYFILYNMAQAIFFLLIAIEVLALVVFIFALVGALSSYFNSIWTLYYLEINKK